MWMPKTEEEIEAVVNSGSLEETAIFDAKREVTRNNMDIAKDIAAMTVNGGVIIYGIGQDKDKRLTVLNPIELAGQEERIKSIVQTAIDEPPETHIWAIRTKSDPAKGYLVVTIPPSSRAPHMVILNNIKRFYARDGTRNIRLGQGEVARLYERRQQKSTDLDSLMDEAIRKAPIEPQADYGYLHLVARPVLGDKGFLKRVTKPRISIEQTLGIFAEEVCRGYERMYQTGSNFPDFRSFDSNWKKAIKGYECGRERASRTEIRPSWIHVLRVDHDGCAYLFYGAAAAKISDLFQLNIADVSRNIVQFIMFLGRMYSAVDYLGKVDIGLAITGIQGVRAVPFFRPFPEDILPIPDSEYRYWTNPTAMAIEKSVLELSEELFLPLIEAASGGYLSFPVHARD